MLSKKCVKSLMNLVSDFSEVSDQKFNIVKLKDDIKFTQNIRGELNELKEGELHLFEKNTLGDCLCLLNNSRLVIIDRRDILEIVC